MIRFILLAGLFVSQAHAAAVTQAVTLDSGLVVNYHVLVDDKVLIIPDAVNPQGTPVPGPVVVFVNSYIDQAGFTAGKKAFKTTPIKITKSAFAAAHTAYWNAILSELSANKATYLGQIK